MDVEEEVELLGAHKGFEVVGSYFEVTNNNETWVSILITISRCQGLDLRDRSSLSVRIVNETLEPVR